MILLMSLSVFFSEIFIRVEYHENGFNPVFVLVFYDLYVTHDLSDDFGALESSIKLIWKLIKSVYAKNKFPIRRMKKGVANRSQRKGSVLGVFYSIHTVENFSY